MEIERKFLVKNLPDNLTDYTYHMIEQGYLCTNPVIRIRRQDADYFLTYKSSGLMIREEINMPLTKKAYAHLKEKVDGNFICKKRYLIPCEPDLTVELDLFESPNDSLIIAEVEFPTKEKAESFIPPSWFGEEVTYSPEYQNSYLSSH